MRAVKSRAWQFLSAMLIASTTMMVAGCEQDDESDTGLNAPLMVPAYPSMTLQSIANTVWSSCEWDKDRGEYLFRIWRFSDNGVVSSAEIEGLWHADTDTDCSGVSTGSIGLTQYVPLQDHGLVSALGWRDEDGNETDNAGAPQSADMLGALPGQPDARRTRLIFKFYYGSGGASFSAVSQLLFLDDSGAEPRLYIGSPAGTADADAFPQYLNSFGVLTPYVE
ncbi:MAG: hypothetical protein V2I38_11605 [Alcanivoracaceae bacterium]|nr:hypothetical protein [Alcanivoracaceae bacterium]